MTYIIGGVHFSIGFYKGCESLQEEDEVGSSESVYQCYLVKFDKHLCSQGDEGRFVLIVDMPCLPPSLTYIL
jgi:hypothetical protein